jgi:flavin reductase (DIM6/NTAB) family NADH-FMN oxidoreductase RutF
VPHTISDLGLPLIHGAIAQLECTTVSVHVEGDHTIFVGRVERARAEVGEPLMYFRGQYDRLANPRPGA